MLHYLVKCLCSKKQCPKAQRRELSCKIQPFKTVAQKYSLNDVGIILFNDKNITLANKDKKDLG